ncbi:MAG: hypothetical protein Q9220_001856 [cf. Caloplaca sp. 1 TL-2023]
MVDPGSPASSSADDGPGDSNEGHWASSQQSQHDRSNTAGDHAANSSGSPEPATSMQKRRRVTRACDECRRKKIKCDGKQPCTHCTVYSYGQYSLFIRPSNRRRNPAPQYVEALENRLHRAETLLRSVLPDVNLDDPKYNALMSQHTHASIKQERYSPSSGMPRGFSTSQSDPPGPGDPDKDSLLESMVHEAGSLDLDDQGHWDFYGQSSGLMFLRRIREQFGDLLGNTQDSIPLTRSSNLNNRLASPRSVSNSPLETNSNNRHGLPHKECARKLCSCALDDAAALLRFIHQPTFYTMFDRVYDIPPEKLDLEDQKFLPLLFAVVALGCLFAKAEESVLQNYGYQSAIDQG